MAYGLSFLCITATITHCKFTLYFRGTRYQSYHPLKPSSTSGNRYDCKCAALFENSLTSMRDSCLIIRKYPSGITPVFLVRILLIRFLRQGRLMVRMDSYNIYIRLRVHRTLAYWDDHLGAGYRAPYRYVYVFF